MDKVRYSITKAPIIRCIQGQVLNVSTAQFLEAVKKQGICVVEVPASGLWLDLPKQRLTPFVASGTKDLGKYEAIETTPAVGQRKKRNQAFQEKVESAMTEFSGKKKEKKVKAEEPNA